VTYSVGSIVKARGREWVVLPASSEQLLRLRPLGGADLESTAILTGLETVEPASFAPPDPERLGDHRSCGLLREAVRLGTRAATGPFRSFGRIAVEPRPYQLVPLLIALRLDPVRLLIADDVGIGKTIEAGLICRELLDRGEVSRLAVLCPPALAEQWQMELAEKFHIEAELVLSSTAARLERRCHAGQSLFQLYPYTVVSLDFIKNDRRRDEFLRACPELVVVDEAHTCAHGQEGRGGRQQRYQLVSGLAADADRHLLLVTATPHSGKQEAFQSLLRLLDPAFGELAAARQASESERRRLARHFVQRRRADIRAYLDADTPFPRRAEREHSYRLSAAYRALFDRAFSYARETVSAAESGSREQRVRWWSVLALLRSLGSSPAAAAQTLRNRAAAADPETAEEVDAVGRATVLDLDSSDASESMEMVPGSDFTAAEGGPDRRRLLEMARAAERLAGKEDAKLAAAAEEIKALLAEGFRPVVFCRFIPTAHYLAGALRAMLPDAVRVEAVTGELPPAEREARIADLAEEPRKVLVCTDCLSEGINLQNHFDAVVHYDLSWNPTRHEQREGRVDRYGQSREEVRVLTLYSLDNRIDGLVLDVLIRKHHAIRDNLGVSIPVPVDSNDVLEALMEGLTLRKSWDAERHQYFLAFEEEIKPRREDLHTRWQDAAEREKLSRTLFAQHTIRPEEVAAELELAREAVGGQREVERFMLEALKLHKALVSPRAHGYDVDLAGAPRGLRDQLDGPGKLRLAFDLPVPENACYLTRTHPLVTALAGYVLDAALDPVLEGLARRAGAIRTPAVKRRATLLLVRFRFDVLTRAGGREKTELCEEVRLLAFSGSPADPEWLEPSEAEALLDARPGGNISPEQAQDFVAAVIEALPGLLPSIEAEAERRAGLLAEAHRRVRAATRRGSAAPKVRAHRPPDLIGVYILLPLPAGEVRS
jgi:superfamily II DNA or RNA helicase